MPVRFMSAILLLAVQAMPAFGQVETPAATYVPPHLEADPADALSRYLRMLAANPRDLASLTGAGRAALAIGDAGAALGFYARAEEIEPRNGRIKAGIGSALVQMEQPDTALRFFADAIRMGVPAAEIALDRGLAHDLRGETRMAQADYQLALRSGPDPEARRRLALSQAIAGDRAAAQSTLRPLLAERDIAARRVNAFVLALTGDSVGASVAASQAMPGEQAAAILPYLARLPALRPAEKAAAVHFGRFPAGEAPRAPQTAYADAATRPGPAGALLMPSGERLGGPAQPERAARSERSRRRPGREPAPASAGAAAMPAATPPPKQAEAAQPAQPVAPVAAIAPSPQQIPAPAASRLAEPMLGPPLPSDFVLRAPRQAQAAPPRKPEPPKIDPAERARLAEKKAAEKKAMAEKAAATKKAEAERKAETAKKAAPERYWVQVASGANRKDLGKAWDRVRAQNKLLAGKTPWTSPWRASNRLLVGPFKTEAEAQGFVNALAKSGMMTMQFTSRAGVGVERLSP